MRFYKVKKNTPALLDIDVYALKRRADILLTAAEMKLEGRLSETKRDFYIHISNCLYRINNLSYLISEKKFPDSHYNWNGPKNITLKYFGGKFKEIAELSDQLLKNACALNETIKIDPAILDQIQPDVIWSDWLEDLEEISWDINDTKEIFMD